MKLKLSSFSLKITFVVIFLFFLTKSNAQATIASWTYDAVQGTPSNPTPNIGSGTSSVVNLAYTPTTASGSTGCTSGNSGFGWQHPNFNPGSSNEGNGVQFKAGTTGYNNIIFTWDQRFSKTSPNTVRLQYTTDGTNWNNFTMSVSNTTFCAGSINGNGCYETNVAESYRRIRVNLSSISGANNNGNFGIRLLASYYRSTLQYGPSNSGSVAGTEGTWRFDNVSFLGTPSSTGAVISGSTSICSGGSANINVTITGGTSPYTLIYSPDGGTTPITITSYISGFDIPVSPTSTTTYTIVSVKDSGNNLIASPSGSAVVTVNAGSSPTFISSAGTNSCASTDIVYTTQSGMDNYSWTFLKNGFPASASTNPPDYIITAGSTASETVTIQWVLAGGNATFSASVTYSSCSGASVSSSTTVYTLPGTPTWTSPPSGNYCVGASTTYTTAPGKSNYTWNFYNGTSSAAPPAVLGTDYTLSSGGTSTSNSAVIIWLTAGSKTVTVNYSNQATPNCQSATSRSNTITVVAPPVISSFGPTAPQTICTGGTFSPLTVVATGSGTITYSWIKKPGNNPVGIGTTFTPTAAASIGYTVTVGNGVTGCSVTSSIAGPFTISTASVGGTVSGSAAVCTSTANTSLSLSGNTGSVLYWQSSTDSTFATGVSTISNTTTSLTATGVTATTYYRAVVQNSPCPTSNSASETVTVSSTTWNGSGWTNGSPTSTKQVVFDSDYTSPGAGVGNLEACSLKVNSNKNVVVSSGDTFNVQNEVLVDASATPGILNFVSGSSLVQVNPSGLINSGNITYKRDVGTVPKPLHGYDYVYWSSPIASQSIDNLYITPSMGYKYYWDTLAYNGNGTGGNTCQGNWAAASGNMDIGKGYIVRASNSFGWTGTLTGVFTGIPNNGTLTVPIARGLYQGDVYPGVNGVSIDKTEDNLNLIGNPYPSAIKAIDFLNANTTIDGNVCLWTHTSSPESSLNPFYSTLTYTTNYATTDYITYNASGSSSGPATFNGYIAAGQGFFVSMVDGPADATKAVTFTNTMRSKGDNSQFFKTGPMLATSENDKHSIWIDLIDATNYFSRALVAYCEGATHQKDRIFDAHTRVADATILYSLIGSESQIIQGRGLPFDENDHVPLGYHAQTAGAFTIAIAAVDGLFEQGQSIYLEDKLLHIIFNLRQAPYVFTTDQGTFNDRFVLRYTDTSLSNSDYSALSSSFIVFKSHDFITIQSDTTPIGEVVVYDIQGRILNDFKNLATSEFQFSAPSTQQVLVLKIITKDNLSFYRKILN